MFNFNYEEKSYMVFENKKPNITTFIRILSKLIKAKHRRNK